MLSGLDPAQHLFHQHRKRSRVAAWCACGMGTGPVCWGLGNFPQCLVGFSRISSFPAVQRAVGGYMMCANTTLSPALQPHACMHNTVLLGKRKPVPQFLPVQVLVSAPGDSVLCNALPAVLAPEPILQQCGMVLPAGSPAPAATCSTTASLPATELSPCP